MAESEVGGSGWITVELTLDDWKRYNSSGQPRFLRVVSFLMLGWTAAAVFVLLAVDTPIGFVMAYVFLALFAAQLVALQRAGRESFSPQLTTVRISPSGYESRSSTHTIWRSWDEFIDVLLVRDLICLRLSRRRAELVPKPSFETEADAEAFMSDARHLIARGPLETLDSSDAFG